MFLKLCIDLCSGREGFCQSFKNDKNWEVVTIDILRKFKPTIVADVCHLPLRENLQPDVLLASPPCEHFSLANWSFPRIGVQKAMQIVGACFEAVAWLKPKKWLIENPRGRLRHLAPSKPRMIIRYSDYDRTYKIQKHTDFWGNIQLPLVPHIRKPSFGKGIKSATKRHHLFAYVMPKSKDLRAFIPKGVSEAVRQGVEETENASQEE